MFVAQQHWPGQHGASNFTHLTERGVTITGQLLAYLVFHFVLMRSNWEQLTLFFSESLKTFSDGFQCVGRRTGGASQRSHEFGRASLGDVFQGRVWRGS